MSEDQFELLKAANSTLVGKNATLEVELEEKLKLEGNAFILITQLRKELKTYKERDAKAAAIKSKRASKKTAKEAEVAITQHDIQNAMRDEHRTDAAGKSFPTPLRKIHTLESASLLLKLQDRPHREIRVRLIPRDDAPEKIRDLIRGGVDTPEQFPKYNFELKTATALNCLDADTVFLSDKPLTFKKAVPPGVLEWTCLLYPSHDYFSMFWITPENIGQLGSAFHIYDDASFSSLVCDALLTSDDGYDYEEFFATKLDYDRSRERGDESLEFDYYQFSNSLGSKSNESELYRKRYHAQLVGLFLNMGFYDRDSNYQNGIPSDYYLRLDIEKRVESSDYFIPETRIGDANTLEKNILKIHENDPSIL